jgi:ABC-2 type transport system permease protein
MIAKLVQLEFKLYFREIAAIIFGILLSPLILVILGMVPAFREPNPDIGGQTLVAIYVPILLAMALAMVALSTMPVVLATYRERGILRRLATTPAQPKHLLLAQGLVQLTVCLIGAVLVVGIGRLAFGVALPANPLAFLVAFILCAVALFGFGMVLSSIGTSKTAQGLGSTLFFPMMFFAGLWVPREGMPEALRKVGDFTPLGSGVQALQDASTGHWPQLLNVVVLLAYGIGAWIVASRMFRWS